MTLRTTEETAQLGEAEARQRQLGQFFTDTAIADFMASLFTGQHREIRLLDAGAGSGALSLAAVSRFCQQARKPKLIEITAYELDPKAVPELRRTLEACGVLCAVAGVQFSFTLHNVDFIEATVPSLRADLFAAPAREFNVAIVNPPYRKIRSDSATRHLLSSAGIETTNLYTAFLSLIIRLLTPGGEIVAITPRSFCNGPYFKPFREEFLELMSLRRIHLFDSRAAAFRGDGVLQENIILHALKASERPKSIIVSTSSGKARGKIKEGVRPFDEVVSPDDPDCFIHLVTSKADESARQKMSNLDTRLGKLGLEVSTGRVVDFRAKEFILPDAAKNTVPLIYPCHFNGGFVHWPKPGGRKPNAIYDNQRTQELLVPGAIYVLVKRFTSKEERRRVVACIYDPKRIHAERVGFENHLNYFHARGAGLPMDLAKGLAVFLNSTFVDVYFRQFNGHTQVNATDLRNMRYPTRAQLECLGRKIGGVFPNQTELDLLIEREIL